MREKKSEKDTKNPEKNAILLVLLFKEISVQPELFSPTLLRIQRDKAQKF